MFPTQRFAISEAHNTTGEKMWEYFVAGGPMMWPLLACSITSLAVIMERFWFWSRVNLKSDQACAAQILANPETAGNGAGIITVMLVTGLAAPPKECAKAMEATALAELDRMRKGMNILDTIITAAPMLGIMGTVIGMIGSFDMLGQAGISEPKAVIAGIAQALITTATGLGISVATIFPYNYFNGRLEHARNLLEIYGTRLELARAPSESSAPEA